MRLRFGACGASWQRICCEGWGFAFYYIDAKLATLWFVSPHQRGHMRNAVVVLACLCLVLAACVTPTPVNEVVVVHEVTATPQPTLARPDPTETPVPQETSTPEGQPQMPEWLRQAAIREDLQWLEDSTGQWMDRVARPAMNDLNSALDASQFDKACASRLVDMSYMLLLLTNKGQPLSELQRAHGHTQVMYESWQSARQGMTVFCHERTPANLNPVKADLGKVTQSYEQLQAELGAVKAALPTPRPPSNVGDAA
jgi:hypothetical protein